MTVGNWKTHLIVNCTHCQKPMGFHTNVNPTCNGCKNGVGLMKSYLSDRVVIYIQSGTLGQKRYYNRTTQGYTARWDGKQFTDTGGVSIRVYYKSFRQHNESLKTWQRMVENDDALTYNKTTFGEVK